MILNCPNCGLPSHDGEEILRCPKCHYMKEFMEFDEFAKLIGVSAITAKRMEKAGKFEAVRPGMRIVRIHCSQYNKVMKLPPD